MSQNNRYMAVSVTETKSDTKRPKVGGQNHGTGVQDASVAALERELAIYKRDSGIEMEELRAKVNNIPKGGGAGEPGKDGVGIESVEQTVVSEESGGENKVEITLTDGQKTEVVIRNGKDGKDGEGGGEGGNVTPESIGAVKKSGDTMTGKLYTSATTNGSFGAASDGGALRIDGGTSYDKGAFLTLFGKDAWESGNFQLVACNGNLRKELKGNPSGSLTWDNNNIYHTGNKPTAADVGASPASHAHSKLTGWSDERSKNTTPLDYVDKFSVVGLKINSSIGITGENSIFSGVVGFKPWGDDSGGKSHELAFGGDGGLYHRSGFGETWGNWEKIATTDYIDEQILKGEW